MRALLASLLLAACATPAKVECACSCPAPSIGFDHMPYSGHAQLWPPSINGLPWSCTDAGFCTIPTGAL